MTLLDEPRRESDREGGLDIDALDDAIDDFRPTFEEPEGEGDGGPRGVRAVLKEALNYRELRRTPYGLTPIMTFAVVGFFQNLDSNLFGQALPEIAQDLRISQTGIIGLQAAFGVLLVPIILGLGYVLDRRPRVPFYGIGTMLSGVGSIVSAGAASFAGLAVPRLADDSAEEAAGIPEGSLVADYYPVEDRGRVFALLGVFARIGSLAAPFTVAYGVSRYGWRSATVFFGAPLILMGALALWKLRDPVRGYMERKAVGATEEEALEEEEPLSFGEAWRSIMGIRTLRRLFVANVWSDAGDTVFTYLYVFFLSEEYGLNIIERVKVSYPSIIAAVIGGYLAGGLLDYFSKTSPSRVLGFSGLLDVLRAVSIGFLAFKPPLWVFASVFAFTSFFGSLTGPARRAIYTQIIPARSRTLGLQLFVIVTVPGYLIFIPLALTLRDQYNFTTGILVAVPLLLIGAVITLSSAGLFEGDRRNALKAAMADHEARTRQTRGEMPLLFARGVDVGYDGVQVLFDVDLEIHEGEVLALLGTNGAGKSTLLRAINGTTQATNGAILFEGRDITRMPPHETAARGIISMPGGRGVFPGLTVRENLVLGNWMNEESEVPERLSEIYSTFPMLLNRADAIAGSLSGGEQQMLSLAQAFLCKPRLLLIDELSLGLSPAIVGELIEVVRRINAAGVTVVVVEQSVNIALTIADRAIFMEKGQIRFDGRTADLLERPDILRAVYVKGTTGAALTDSPSMNRRPELATAPVVLEVDGLTKRFGGITAVDDVSFELRGGEVLGLIGPNGSGKTTLLELISGYQAPDVGRIRFEGIDVTDLPPDERARRGMIRRFQDARAFGSLTVFETILVALDQRLEVRSTVFSAFALPTARRAENRLRKRADRLVELLELGAYRDKFINELSTGLRRIVDLGCVLAAEPKLLLLDEPSTGIAQTEAEGLGPLLGRVRFETGCSILIVEHDMTLITAVSDELLALELGHTVVRGTAEAVLNDERVIEAYLGTTEAIVNRSGSAT
jgi:branched-chain amino acid transport system ATP-binding protein